jgi:hypothetical protein
MASVSKSVGGKPKHIRSDEWLIEGLAAPREELKMNIAAAHIEHLEGTDLQKSRAYCRHNGGWKNRMACRSDRNRGRDRTVDRARF